MINNHGGQAGGGGPDTRSHKSLSNCMAGSLQKAPGPSQTVDPGPLESLCFGAPDGSAAQCSGLTALTLSSSFPLCQAMYPPYLSQCQKTHASLDPLTPGKSRMASAKGFPDAFRISWIHMNLVAVGLAMPDCNTSLGV